MSISKRGSSTPVGDDAPLGDNTSVGDQFNRLEVGDGRPRTTWPAPGLRSASARPRTTWATPGLRSASARPRTTWAAPGLEIGISAPTTDDVVPADSAPAGDDTSSGDAGDSLAGLGTWESVIATRTIADEHDEDTNQKGGGASFDPRAANTPGSPGQLLTLGTNPDGSHFFTGNRNVDATLIGSKWGTTNLTYSFPTSGSNYNGTNFDSNGVSLYHIDLGTQQQAAARAAFAQLSALTGLTFTEITDTDTRPRQHPHLADRRPGRAVRLRQLPVRHAAAVAGDIWFGRNNQPYYDLAFKGTWGFATMMHEIGHTMGLKHGHQDYTNSDLSGYLRDVRRASAPSP